MRTSRRGLLGGGLAAVAGLFVPRQAAALPRTGGVLPFPVQYVPLGRQPFDHRHAAFEIDKFAKAIGWNQQPMIHSISVPFATTPLNVYMRTPETHQQAPEPQLQDLLTCCRRPDGGREELQAIVDFMWSGTYTANTMPRVTLDEISRLRREAKAPVKWPGGPRLLPDRVTTPRYTIDIVELDCRTLARTILETIAGLDFEVQTKWRLAWEQAREHFPGETLVPSGVADTPQVWTYAEDAKAPCREAGTIWSCYTFLHTAGIIEPLAQRIARQRLQAQG
jgi:hypothetical protein